MPVPLTVNVPEQLDETYKAIARRRLVSKSDVVREALLAHVQKTHAEMGEPQLRFARRRAKKEAA